MRLSALDIGQYWVCFVDSSMRFCHLGDVLDDICWIEFDMLTKRVR